MENTNYHRLKDLREDHDLTLRQLAKKLDMPYTQYWRYEKGQREIPVKVLLKLAEFYETSIDYILGRTDDPTWNGNENCK